MLDDIIIGARSKQEHDKILNQVLERTREHNVKFNSKKMQYKTDKVTYLGLEISKNGVKTTDEYVNSIKRLKIPIDRKELSRFLVMLSYIGKFIPNLSELTAPLRPLNSEKK